MSESGLLRDLSRLERDGGAARPKRAVNWALIIGWLIVAAITTLAIIGPQLAPRDPLEDNLIIQVEGKWLRPPYPLFTPGFPLGSDQYGRDLYSRILWGIRPTMIMVALVAVVRLVIGVVIGMAAGWFSGRLGRSLDILIESAVAVPVLLVALAAIAVVGVELGIWAFIIGLGLNGWVETAQQVREQTRIIKGQVYVEAAVALGASGRQVLVQHILRQVLPMVWMLLAFEVSSTLMATAGLGFLGYYIGGDVWIEVGDFVSRRISGMPELGQMLATSWMTLTRPWAMLMVGTIVFVTVLGFNLLGEGFRQRVNQVSLRRRTRLGQAWEKLRFGLDQYVWYPLGLVLARPPVRLAAWAAIVVIIFGTGGRWAWPRLQDRYQQLAAAWGSAANGAPTAAPISQAPATPTPNPPTYSPQVAWTLQDSAGFSGGPALAADGERLYVLSAAGMLRALDLKGGLIWQLQLPAGGVGGPAVGAGGVIYASDIQAGLHAITPQGALAWSFQSTAAPKGVSGPALGPDGSLYYTVATSSKAFIQAVTNQGQGLWAVESSSASFYRAPVVSKDGRYIFFKEEVYNAADGSRINLKSDLRINLVFGGDDGNLYLLSDQRVIQWRAQGETIEVLDATTWTMDSATIVARRAGITPQRIAWSVFTSPGGDTEVVWEALEGQVLGSAVLKASDGRVIEHLAENVAYVCGGRSFEPRFVICAALAPQEQEPLWQLLLANNSGPVLGGVFHAGVLYVTTEGGDLFAVEENKSQPVVAKAQTLLAQPGVAWAYPIGERLSIDPVVAQDGTIYLVTRKNELLILEPNGSLRNAIPLDFRLGMYGDSSFDREVIPPHPLSDGSLIVFTNRRSVLRMAADGEIRWETSYPAELAAPPLFDKDGFYLVDQEARLMAFDQRGKRWEYQSQVAKHPTEGLAIGPEGNLYYGVTNFSQGFVQAVSPDGQGLWASPASTDFFFDPLVVSADGGLVFLREDAFETGSGQLVPLAYPLRVDEIILGEDRRLYMRSDLTVIQWQAGQQGFEGMHTISFGRDSVPRFPPVVRVSQSSTIWMSLTESGLINMVWLSLDGKVLGTHRLNPSDTLMVQSDLANDRLAECNYQADGASLSCSTYVVGVEKPVWELSVPGISPYSQGILSGDVGRLTAYLVGKDNTLYQVWLGGLPAGP